MTDKGTQGFTVRLPGQVDHDVLEVLTQGTEQHVQLGSAGTFQRLVALGISQQAQTGAFATEGAVDQGVVQAAQVTQGITEMERCLQPQQRQAIATGQP
ncbi:hypothetical protein D3C72_1514120 [compost metagenome]